MTTVEKRPARKPGPGRWAQLPNRAAKAIQSRPGTKRVRKDLNFDMRIGQPFNSMIHLSSN
jgi:hypothetical protein